MTDLKVTDDALEFTVEGMDKLWALHSHLSIPLRDVAGVRSEPELGPGLAQGLKLAGSLIPGVLQAGTFLGHQGMVFWDVHRPGHAIVVDLQHEHYKQLVVDVPDPEQAVAEIQAALRARGTSPS